MPTAVGAAPAMGAAEARPIPTVLALAPTVVGDPANQVGQVDAYTRVDLYSEYKIDKTWKVFARGENILNEHYQEVLNFGTTGPAMYAGFNATW